MVTNLKYMLAGFIIISILFGVGIPLAVFLSSIIIFQVPLLGWLIFGSLVLLLSFAVGQLVKVSLHD